MKKDGTLATVPMIATYKVMLGVSLAFVASEGQISWPNAPPKGFDRDAIAVAEILP